MESELNACLQLIVDDYFFPTLPAHWLKLKQQIDGIFGLKYYFTFINEIVFY